MAECEAALADLADHLDRGGAPVFDDSRWSPESWPREAEGIGWVEAARGALGHWVRVRAARIAAYQVIDASTWNLSPRDAGGRPGPVESALVGVPVADGTDPRPVLRVVNGFAPCVGCAAH